MEISNGNWVAEVNDQRASGGLTPMQATYLIYLADGMTQKEIARATGRSPKTVRHGLEQAYCRLGVSRASAAVAKAVSLRVIRRVTSSLTCLLLALTLATGADDGYRNRGQQRMTRRQTVLAIYA